MTNSALPLSPVDNNYLTSRLVYQQLTQNTKEITLAESGVSASVTPKVLLDGQGRAYLQGQLTITADSPAANMEIFSLPEEVIPLADIYYPVTILRAGAYVANAIKINSNGSSIDSVTISNPGRYVTVPTLLATPPGTGATLAAVMRAVNNGSNVVTIAAAGSGYAPADTVTLTGGTASQQAILTIATTKIASAAVNAAGTGYVPGNTVTLAGGTFTTAGIFTVTHTKVVSATVAAGGSGGSDGTQTVTGTTGTGTKFQASVTVASGAITAVLSITVAGDYTVNPTLITNEPVTGASLSGAALSVVMGVLTVSITNAGVYTVNTTSFTQSATSGVGTGVTFNTALFGINTATVRTPGSYTVLPSNPVSQGSTSGSGTSATFTMRWGILSVTVSAGGTGYTSQSDFLTSGGSEEVPAVGVLVLADSTERVATLINAATDNDVVVLDNVQFIVQPYD